MLHIDVDQQVEMVVQADQLPASGAWTYADYATLPNDQRYEIVDGVLYMAPAPGTDHQSANNLFQTHLTIHIQFKGLGRVFGPPCDVELAPNTVIQPDVVVVLNEHADIITPSRIIGAPDLVVEIASPGTAGYDRRDKQDSYARAGVPEYWIADPAARTVEVLQLEGQRYRPIGVFRGKALLPSPLLGQFPTPVEQFSA